MAAINYNFRYARRNEILGALTGTLRISLPPYFMSCWLSLERMSKFSQFRVRNFNFNQRSNERKNFFRLPIKYTLTKCYHALSADQLFMHTLHVEPEVEWGLPSRIQINSFVVDSTAVHFTSFLARSLTHSIKLNLLCLFSFFFHLLLQPHRCCLFIK
jgi:hypothetical protein